MILFGKKPKKETKKLSDDGLTHSTTRQINNHVYFYNDVTPESISELRETIFKADLETMKLTLQTGSTIPLHLHIYSYGGYLDAGFAAADFLRQTKCPLHTHIEGAVASAATLLSLSGVHRTIGKHSYCRIHQLRAWAWGKYEEIKEEVQNLDLSMKRIREFYEETTNIPKADLDVLLTKEVDLTPKQCLDWGVVHEIL